MRMAVARLNAIAAERNDVARFISPACASGYAGGNTELLLECTTGAATGKPVPWLPLTCVGTIADRMPTVVELIKRETSAVGSKINPFDATLRRPAQSLSSARTSHAIQPAGQDRQRQFTDHATRTFSTRVFGIFVADVIASNNVVNIEKCGNIFQYSGAGRHFFGDKFL